ncbi:MAG: C45 family autoproteolytic acyltransferase/hydrolase [Erysipelotrichaceae bacterium]|nr:C45 family autoproteolytic acyltransferase/hydrolase [Erysipelotrichaceae bacterium]
MTIKRIKVNGNNYECGFQYGKAASEMIRNNIDNYQCLIKDRKNILPEQAHRIALKYQTYIPTKYLEEMQGIADGAQVNFVDILLLNCRSELLFKDDQELQECTAFALMPKITSTHDAYACQTWDFARSQKDNVVLLEIDSDVKIMMITEAGLIGGKGLNSSGIGLTLNALNTNGKDMGVPLHVRMRMILTEKTLASAYQKAVNMPIPVSANLIISCKDGLALGLELTPNDFYIYYPEKGIIYHTNHIVSDSIDIIDKNRPFGNSFVRFANIKSLLEDASAIDLNMIKKILQDHRGHPNGICVHADESLPLIKQHGTNHAVIMDLTNLSIHYVHGNPCQDEYQVYSLVKDLS